MKKLKEIRNITEAEKTKGVVFSFGRFNPPTTGHEKLIKAASAIAKVQGDDLVIFASQSEDPKKNPLSFTDKVKFMRKMFRTYASAISQDKGVKTAFDAVTKLYDMGYREVTMIVGADRIKEFDTLLNKYNGVKGRHGFYDFPNGIQIKSAGEREDPDSDAAKSMSADAMSASLLRKIAADGDFDTFIKGVPDTLGTTDKRVLFNKIRTGMKLAAINEMFELLFDDTLLNEEQELVCEKAPPDEKILKWTEDPKVKASFKDQYGDKWAEVMYATAWKMYKDKQEEWNVDEELDEDWSHAPSMDAMFEETFGDLTKKSFDMVRESLMREEIKITQQMLNDIEKYADKLFAKLGIDVEFTRHFLDRVNDERNKKQITQSELIRLFKQTHKQYGRKIAQLGPDAQAVINDMMTDINMPFVLNWDDRNQELDLVAKTVMRKKNFATSNTKLQVSEFDPLEEKTDDGKHHSWKSDGHYTADGQEWTGPQHYNDEMQMVMTGSEPSIESVPLYHYKELPKEVRAKIEAGLSEGKNMSRAQQAAIAISKKEKNGYVTKTDKKPKGDYDRKVDSYLKKKYQKEDELEKDEDDPCWKGYVQVGMKKKGGKEVPNCVPMSELVEGDKWTDKQAEREHSKLFLKALKTMPGSPKQKEIIQQMNVLRKAQGLPLLGEDSPTAKDDAIMRAGRAVRKSFKKNYTAEERLLKLGEVTSNFLPQIDDLDGDGIPDDPFFNTQTRLVPFEVKISGFPSFILWSVSISKVRSAIRGTLKRLDDIEYIERITDVEARAVHKRRYDQFNRNPLRTKETGKKVAGTDLDQAYLSRQDAYYRESYERGTDELVKAYKKATPGELEEAPQWVKEIIAKYFKQNKYEKAAQGLIRYMDKMSDKEKKAHGVEFYADQIIRMSTLDLDARILAKTAKKILATEAIFYAKRNKKSLHEIYRPHSEMYYELFETARELGAIVEGADKYLLEDTDIGEFSRYEGKMVPLDIPLIEETDVELNSPKRGGSKKFYVYVKNDKGNVVKVSFGDDTGLQAKINDAEATKSFVARHDCANKKDKTTPGYWACRLPMYAKELGLEGGGDYFW
jgi:Asp-tRNA(Asn)/Glu-tRNA(Gln) amidotransferase C subunit